MMQTRDVPIHEMSIRQLTECYRSKALSPVEVADYYLGRIDESQATVNAFITVCHELAIQAARESERRYLRGQSLGELDGIPYSAKDLFYTKGIPTTMGCAYYKDFVPEEDAEAIARLKRQGAVLLGKNNTQQFALGATGDRSFAGPVRNPHDLGKIAGGSSSGSAAAVAAGLCVFSLGTDTGGSARVPAALCGVVGMKPTYAKISARGVFPASTTFDTVGIITRTVEDNAVVLNYIAGHDPRALVSRRSQAEDYTSRSNQSIKGKRICAPFRQIEGVCQPAVEKGFSDALQRLKQNGAILQEVMLPDWAEYRKVRMMILFAEAYAVHKELYTAHPEVYDEEVRLDLEAGSRISADEYIGYMKERQKFLLEFRDFFRDTGLMAYPATTITATDVGFRGEILVGGQATGLYEALSRFNWFTSMSGYPAIVVPTGTHENLPIGIQFAANEDCEDDLYQAARAC